MKRYLRMAAVFMAAVLLSPKPVCAISAKKAIVLDATTERVLFEKDADSRSLIASTTKIMTALIVCEQCNVLDRMRIPKEAVGIEGSSMYLQEGEVLTIQELLYGLMLHSGNDAAVALAIYCGGTVEGFAQLMNDKARLLGMTGTNFENPNGLDSPGHYSTARDLAILSAYAMNNPIFAKTVSTKTVTIGHRNLRNHNKLLWRVDGAEGIKTGFTKAAGRLLVSSVLREGRRLIAVTIDDGNDWQDHADMMNKGFSEYSVSEIISEGEILGRIVVLGGVEDWVEVYAAEDFSYSISPTEMPYVLLSEQSIAYAPVVEGQAAGEAYVCVGEKVVGRVPIKYTKTVEQIPQQKKNLWERLLRGDRI